MLRVADTVPPGHDRVDDKRMLWRRWRVLRAHMTLAHERREEAGGRSVRGGFVNHMIELEQLEDDGLIDEDGRVVWLWSDNTPGEST